MKKLTLVLIHTIVILCCLSQVMAQSPTDFIGQPSKAVRFKYNKVSFDALLNSLPNKVLTTNSTGDLILITNTASGTVDLSGIYTKTQTDSIATVIRSEIVSGGGAISTVFGRTGAVVALSGDYSAFYQPIGSYPTTAYVNATFQLIGSYATVSQNNLKVNITDTSNMLSHYLKTITAAALYQPIGTYITGSGSVSGVNTGDQNLSGIYTKTQSDSVTTQVRSEITTAAGGGVTSFNSRSGAVVPLTGDYSTFYPLLNGTGATGTWGISVTGNAATATNATNAAGLSADIPESRVTNLITDLAAKVNITDTASMLVPYVRANVAAATYATITNLNLRLLKTDTASMLTPYLRSSTAAGIYATIANDNLKLLKTDTATMLSPYVRKGNNLADLTNIVIARNSLGLGTLSTQNGTFSGTSSGSNTGDETNATIKSKLGIVSGSVDGYLTAAIYNVLADKYTQAQSRQLINDSLNANTFTIDSARIGVALIRSAGYNSIKVKNLIAGNGITVDRASDSTVRVNTYRSLIKLSVDINVGASANTFQDITGLSFNAASGIFYNFEATIIYNVDASTTGVKFGINGPASPTLLGVYMTYPTAASQVATISSNTYDQTASTTTSSPFALGNIAVIKGIIRTSSTGTVILRFGSEIALASSVVIKAGSTLEIW